jgi:hypothetical protein
MARTGYSMVSDIRFDSISIHWNQEFTLAREIDPDHPMSLLRGFEQALLCFFLALDAVPRPRHGFETLGINLFAARNTFSKAAFADPSQGSIHHIE